MDKVLFSSNSDEWATPNAVFEELNKEFNFTLDACATAENAKCSKFFTKEEDGLAQNWGGNECSVTRLTPILANGCKRPSMKGIRITH